MKHRRSGSAVLEGLFFLFLLAVTLVFFAVAARNTRIDALAAKRAEILFLESQQKLLEKLEKESSSEYGELGGLIAGAKAQVVNLEKNMTQADIQAAEAEALRRVNKRPGA